MYLDPVIRSASSTFASLPPALIEPGIERLRNVLQSGVWNRRYGYLLTKESADYGHRTLVAG